MRYNYLFLILLSLLTKEILSQACCSVGTSVSGGAERGVINYKNLSIALSFQNNVLDDTYNGSENIDDPLNRKSNVTDIFLELEYGVTESVSILIAGGYTSKSRTTNFIDSETNTIEEITFSGRGFSDVVIIGKYEILKPNILSPLSISLGGGAKLPTGSYQLEENGTRLSIDLQPGSGATDLLLWAHTNYNIPLASLGFNLNALYRYTGTNLDAYRYGDEFLATINSTYAVVEFLAINLQFKGRFAAKDYWNNRFLPSTGGTYFDLSPSIIYTESSFNLRILYQLPLYRDVEGIQLTVSEKLLAEFRYQIDLN